MRAAAEGKFREARCCAGFIGEGGDQANRRLWRVRRRRVECVRNQSARLSRLGRLMVSGWSFDDEDGYCI